VRIAPSDRNPASIATEVGYLESIDSDRPFFSDLLSAA
jgi:hypothetical protein